MKTWEILTDYGKKKEFQLVCRLTEPELKEINRLYCERKKKEQSEKLFEKEKDDPMKRLRREAYQWRLKAEAGDACAQKKLGDLYRAGRGVPVSRKLAFEWYQKAASGQNLDAKLCLGDMYLKGDVVGKDVQKALGYYREAALYKVPGAQQRLGDMYLNGWGVRQDSQEAWKWYNKAAQQGDAQAIYQMGLLCQQGNGQPLDYDKAIEYYEYCMEMAGDRSMWLKEKCKMAIQECQDAKKREGKKKSLGENAVTWLRKYIVKLPK